MPAYISPNASAMVQLNNVIHTTPGNTLLLMVEQAVAMHAAVFVGTPSSSATWVLAQERMGARIGESGIGSRRRRKRVASKIKKAAGTGVDDLQLEYMLPEDLEV